MQTETVDEYLFQLSTLHGKSQNTILAYRRDLYLFLGFLDVNRISYGDVTIGNLDAFYKSLANAHSKSSIARLNSSLRGFYDYMFQSGQIASNPLAEVSAFKVPERLPKALSTDEVNSLLNSIGNHSEADIRDSAILEILYGTGMRISELVNLSMGDLLLEEQLLSVVGKGSKQRLVPIGRYAREALMHWLGPEARMKILGRSRRTKDSLDSVFVNLRGNRLTRQGAWLILKERAAKVGLADKFSPHVLRHTCATHMLDNGADIRVVQELLGHVSVATTQIYTKVSNERIRSVYFSAHPRAIED